MLNAFIKNLIPGKIELELLKKHVGPFLFCFLTIMFLLLMQFLIQFMDHLVGKGIPFSVIIELIMVNLAYMVVLAVPMTILASSLIAYGRFSEYNEYTAVRAAGIHPYRMIRPVLWTAILFAFFLGWFSNDVLPEANYKARALFLDIRMKKPGFDLQENTFYEGIEGYTFLIKERLPETDSLFDITLFQHSEKGRDKAIIKAKSGLLESNERQMNLTLYLYDGTILRYLQTTGESSGIMHEETDFDTYRITFDLSDFSFSRTNPDNRKRDGRSMSAQTMLAVVDSLKRNRAEEIRKFKHSIESSLISLKEQNFDLNARGNHEGKTNSLDSNFNSTTIQNQIPSKKKEIENVVDIEEIHPPASGLAYVTLSMHSSLKKQKELVRRGISEARKSMAKVDDLGNNVRWRQERIARYLVEVHKKASIPFACILFALIGAPLGLLVQKGNMGIHALISTVLFTYYWISIIQGEKLADRLIISPFAGMWFANITIGVVALVLLYVAFFKR